jgi:hypothetical protein
VWVRWWRPIAAGCCDWEWEGAERGCVRVVGGEEKGTAAHSTHRRTRARTAPHTRQSVILRAAPPLLSPPSSLPPPTLPSFSLKPLSRLLPLPQSHWTERRLVEGGLGGYAATDEKR